MDKLVSVIIPVFNIEKYLETCIESVLRQTHSNLEIILIDDGSTDNSPIICKNYEKNDSRIKYIRQSNRGVSAARNFGIKIAKGDYICFLDSDDWIESNMIEVLLKQMIDTNSDISICSYRIYNELDCNYKYINQSLKEGVYTSNQILQTIFLTNEINGFLWNKMFKKEILLNNLLPEHLDICEDLYIVCKILNDDYRISYTMKNLYNYRNHNISATKHVERLFNNEGFKYTQPYSSIIDMYKEEHEICELIQCRYVKTVLEVYILLLKNKIAKRKYRKILFEILKKYRKIYFDNRLIGKKYKFVFLIIYLFSLL